MSGDTTLVATPGGNREVGTASSAPTIGVLAAESDSLVVALLRAAGGRRCAAALWLGSYRVDQVCYDPRDRAATRVVLRPLDEAADAPALELGRDVTLINLGIPTRTDPDLDEVDRPYAAAEWRAAWLAALAVAPGRVLNRPSGQRYWLLESSPMLLRRCLRGLEVATLPDRVIPTAALGRHQRQGWRVGASTISRRAQSLESLTPLPGEHYRVSPLRPPVRQSVRAVLLGRVVPLQLSPDGVRLVHHATDEEDALAATSIEVCRLLELDIGFVTFVETQGGAQVSLAGTTPPRALDALAAAALADCIVRRLTTVASR